SASVMPPRASMTSGAPNAIFSSPAPYPKARPAATSAISQPGTRRRAAAPSAVAPGRAGAAVEAAGLPVGLGLLAVSTAGTLRAKKRSQMIADDGASGAESVQAAQLVLELVLQVGIGDRHRRAGRGGQRPGLPPGQPVGGVAERDRRGAAHRVRQQPGQPVEPLVDRRGQRDLAAVLLDEELDDVLAGLALRQQLVDLDPVLRRVAAAFGGA